MKDKFKKVNRAKIVAKIETGKKLNHNFPQAELTHL